MPQEVPLQVAMQLGSVGQGVHEAPQELTLVSLEQRPLQSWVPEGHMPLQAFCMGMHWVMQSLSVGPQAPPHWRPSQVAVPPLGGVQGVQEVPQLAGE